MSVLVAVVEAAAPAQRLWDAVTDWEHQGQWMLGTRVEVSEGDGREVGSMLRAWTGIGPLGFVDEMQIEVWEPPHRCEVRHYRKPVTGRGVFLVEPAGPQRSRLLWLEALSYPLGPAAPIARAALQVSLRRLAASL